MKKAFEAAFEKLLGAMFLVGFYLFVGVMTLIGFVITPCLRWRGKLPETANGKDVDDFYTMVTHFKAGDLGVLEAREAGFATGRDPFLKAPWFHVAIENGTLPVVTWFVDHGAEVNLYDGGGQSPLTYAILRACEADDAAVALEIARLLLARGARLDLCDAFGSTPLHIAVKRAPMEIITLLLDHGADPLRQNDDYPDETPLDLAKRAGRWGVVDEIDSRIKTASLGAVLQSDQ